MDKVERDLFVSHQDNINNSPEQLTPKASFMSHSRYPYLAMDFSGYVLWMVISHNRALVLNSTRIDCGLPGHLCDVLEDELMAVGATVTIQQVVHQ